MEDESVDPEILKDTLEGVDGELEIKAENCAKVIAELGGKIDVIDREIERLKGKKDVLNNNIKWIKQQIEKSMIDTGKRKFKTDLFSFGIQKNPPAVVIDQEDQIPEEYWIAQEPKLDRTAIKKWLKENEADWAHLTQTESLRIR
jgi:hypothetical protein